MSVSTKKYLTAGIWYTVGNILVKGISFISLPLFTRLLTTEDFGRFNIFLSYENIIYILLGLGIAGTIKTAFFDFKEDFNKYFSSVVSLTVLFTLLVDLITNIVLLFIGINEFEGFWDSGLINLLVWQSLATALYTLISTKYVIEAEYKKNLAISFIYTLSSVLISIVLCFGIFSAERYLARIVGNAVPLMVIAYGISLIYIFKFRVVFDRKYWSYALRMGSPLILHSLSMVLLQQIGKISIDYYCGSEVTGIYSVAVTLVTVLTVLLSSFDNAWAPWFYRGLNEGNYTSLVRGNSILSQLFAAVCVLFILVGPELVAIMSTEAYADAVYSFIPLSIAVFVNFMYLFAVNQEYFYHKTKTIALGTVVAAALAIVLNFTLIPVFGYLSAAFVDIVCKFVMFSIHTVVVHHWGKPSVVSVKSLLVLLAGVVSVGVATFVFRDSLVIRYLIFAFVLALSIAKGKRFVEIVKQ